MCDSSRLGGALEACNSRWTEVRKLDSSRSSSERFLATEAAASLVKANDPSRERVRAWQVRSWKDDFVIEPGVVRAGMELKLVGIVALQKINP